MNMKIEMIGDAQSFTSIKRGLYGTAYSGMSGEDDREILQQLDIMLGAYVDGQPAGRVALCYGEGRDTLSHFEAKDQWVGSALLRSAMAMTSADRVVLGECDAGGAECMGFLAECHEEPVAFERTTPLWYDRCAKACGFEEEKEFYTYTLTLADVPRGQLKEAADFLRQKGLYARSLNLDNWEEWADELYQMLGETIERREFRRQVQDMAYLSDDYLGWGVYAGRRLVAVVFGIYDYAPMFNGGGTAGDRLRRMVTFQVREQKLKFVFHHSILPGAVVVAYDRLLEELEKRKVRKIYLGDILARDGKSLRTLEHLGAVRDKIYRTYQLDKHMARA